MPRVDGSSDIGIIVVSGEEVEIEVRKGVAVDLVVDLDGLVNFKDSSRDGHGVEPKRRLRLWRQFERLAHVLLAHDTHITG